MTETDRQMTATDRQMTAMDLRQKHGLKNS